MLVLVFVGASTNKGSTLCGGLIDLQGSNGSMDLSVLSVLSMIRNENGALSLSLGRQFGQY